jgi:protein TonB
MALSTLRGLVVFTSMMFPVATFYFLENSPAPVLGNMSYSGVGITRSKNRSWLALSLVLCAHLAVFAALRPQSQSIPVETIPEPIMISLLSAPQTASQKPVSPVQPMTKAQKPIKKPVKTPISKPVVPRASQPVVQPIEQTSTPATPTSLPAAEPESKATNSKPADAPSYQSPSFNAAYLNNPAPHYPSVSRRLGEQGLVLLRVQVTADGTAGSVELQTGSGSSRLDEAALEAVKKWQFVPAKRGDQPVSASVVVPVRFSIEG